MFSGKFAIDVGDLMISAVEMQVRVATHSWQTPHPDANQRRCGELHASGRRIGLESPIDGTQAVSIDVEDQSPYSRWH
ncbi:MAG: hypothetical protein O3C28_03090 [Proteobacteria bacterium]|nr:hypothetical protein [Pseudomonadota bacterium]